MAAKSKILVIGAAGYVGKFLVQASAKDDHPTSALVRESTVSTPQKSSIVEGFKNLGVTIVHGDIHNHQSLVRAIKQVDVVISAVGGSELAHQLKIIAAIKESGNIKRFLPSEFGGDVDRSKAVEPAASIFATKAKIRRMIESEGIPYTYIVCNACAGYFLPNLGQLAATSPPRDKVVILGDGNPKAFFVNEQDIATYTIKAVDDPRTVNKILYMRPLANIMSFNELVSMWENKIGKPLERTYVLEDQLLKNIEESTPPLNVLLALCHSVLVNGSACNFEIDSSLGFEACDLYPEVKYTTVDEYLNQFV